MSATSTRRATVHTGRGDVHAGRQRLVRLPRRHGDEGRSDCDRERAPPAQLHAARSSSAAITASQRSSSAAICARSLRVALRELLLLAALSSA